MEDLARLFKALSDPTRLRIVNLLLSESGCVCELEAVLELPQSLISRHLSYLRNAGLVRDNRRGVRIDYSMAMDDASHAALREALGSTLQAKKECKDDIRRWKSQGRLALSPVRAKRAAKASVGKE